jgi:hypothetical protein
VPQPMLPSTGSESTVASLAPPPLPVAPALPPLLDASPPSLGGVDPGDCSDSPQPTAPDKRATAGQARSVNRIAGESTRLLPNRASAVCVLAPARGRGPARPWRPSPIPASVTEDEKGRGELWRRPAGRKWSRIRIPPAKSAAAASRVFARSVQAFGVGDVWVGAASTIGEDGERETSMLLSTKRPKFTLRNPASRQTTTAAPAAATELRSAPARP